MEMKPRIIRKKKNIMEFISDLSLLRDNDDNPYLKAQNKACQDNFLWILLFKEVELIRNNNFSIITGG